MTADQLALWQRIDAFDIDGGPCRPAVRRPAGPRERLVTVVRRPSRPRVQAVRLPCDDRRPADVSVRGGRSGLAPAPDVHSVLLAAVLRRGLEDAAAPRPDPRRRGRGPQALGDVRRHARWPTRRRSASRPRPTCGRRPDQRFGADLEVARVNRNEYWLVRKPPTAAAGAGRGGARWSRWSSPSVVPATRSIRRGPTSCRTCFVAWGMAYVLGLIVRRMYKGGEPNPDEPAPELGPYEVAYLTGGRPRVLATALVRLQGQGRTTSRRRACHHPAPRRTGPTRSRTPSSAALAKQSGNTLDLRPLDAAVREAETSKFIPFGKLARAGPSPDHERPPARAALPLLLCLGTHRPGRLAAAGDGAAKQPAFGVPVASLIVTHPHADHVRPIDQADAEGGRGPREPVEAARPSPYIERRPGPGRCPTGGGPVRGGRPDRDGLRGGVQPGPQVRRGRLRRRVCARPAAAAGVAVVAAGVAVVAAGVVAAGAAATRAAHSFAEGLMADATAGGRE